MRKKGFDRRKAFNRYVIQLEDDDANVHEHKSKKPVFGRSFSPDFDAFSALARMCRGYKAARIQWTWMDEVWLDTGWLNLRTGKPDIRLDFVRYKDGTREVRKVVKVPE